MKVDWGGNLTRLLRGLGFGLAAGLIALLLGLTGLARTAEMKLYDPNTMHCSWVVEFPMFDFDDE